MYKLRFERNDERLKEKLCELSRLIIFCIDNYLDMYTEKNIVILLTNMLSLAQFLSKIYPSDRIATYVLIVQVKR